MRVAPLIVSAVVLLLLVLISISELARALLLGWVLFLWRVVPRIEMNWGSVVLGLVAAALFAAGFHWMVVSWYGQESAEQTTSGRPWKLRWSLLTVAAIFLLFAIGISLVGIVHQTSWLLTSPEPMFGSALKTHGSGRNNLVMMGLEIRNHQAIYGGLPSRWAFRPNGAPLHSWETRILPFLFDIHEIDLKRPWDDPVNQSHFQKVVPVFINPDLRTAEFLDSDRKSVV